MQPQQRWYPPAWLSVPGDNTVGTPLVNVWGTLYPRQGFIVQPNRAKASAVIALRGGNIATTPTYSHVSINLAGQPCPEKACTTAGPIVSHAPKTAWQMLLPEYQTSCHQRIDYQPMPGWVRHATDNQAYVWVVWREYRGCIAGSGHYLGSTGG